ncbi:MAG TPA: flagellar basal body L-ring protein FlgH [Allosphingosinicella sp.]|jgi:flagellar L-ring protein precursor FlgH
MTRCNLLACVVLLALGTPAAAEDLYRNNSWAALAGDRSASAVGDIVTVLVFERSDGANSAETGSERDLRLNGSVSAGNSFSQSAGLDVKGGSRGRGRTEREGRMLAQISVTVEHVLPNGDLAIAGTHMLRINGERTNIRLRGRIRRADISSDNVVLSARIADAEIEYHGNGYVSRSAKPGIVQRVFNFLGLM